MHIALEVPDTKRWRSDMEHDMREADRVVAMLNLCEPGEHRAG
jgi:hypothetical protein